MVLLAGCSAPDDPSSQETVLIRTDGQRVTLAQFERAFEAARIAYSDNRSVDPQVLQEARLRLLNQMAEEAVIDRRADELGIELDDVELEAGIQAIRKDYPEDEFEQMLLESAIPYSLWKDRLRTRLLMEKVVDQDLVQTLTITAKDIETYYKAHEAELSVKDGEAPETDLKRIIVEQLRREKVEAAYPQWMDALRIRYGVEINWDVWGRSQDPDGGSDSQGKE
ncbi:SurA N-terminal domain-containing protein [Desulfosarcina sp.]|uniref:SurA N-terminal domain-containing protein n=1 Tax=Desulfosarcina sp. TaxID=2027861 RepID=UPI003970A7B6